MFKNILILGPRRSGKTTFAKVVSDKYGYNIISLDNIIETFNKIFPKSDNDDNYDEYIVNFINMYIDKLSCDNNFFNGRKYVIEGNVPNIEKIIENIDGSRTMICGLVYDKLDTQGLFDNMRKYDESYEWTRYLSDDSLLSMTKDFVKENKIISDKFDAYGVNKYDVSENRNETFDNIINELENYANYSSLVYTLKKD